MTSNRSSTIKEKLDALELVENEDYRLRDVSQNLSFGGRPKKVYLDGAVVSTPRESAGDRGSIPRQGNDVLLFQ